MKIHFENKLYDLNGYSGSILNFLTETCRANLNFSRIVAVKINNNIFDLRDDIAKCLVDLKISNDVNLTITLVSVETEDGLDVLRHDTAHVLAQAVKEIYGDQCQITIGPNIDNGFYYDIFVPFTIAEEDLAKIEKKMQEIVKKNAAIEKFFMPVNDAVVFFSQQGEKFKAEIIQDLITKNNVTEVSLYKQESFIDLCRGPHSMTTGVEKFFKLTHVSGAYWRGDAKNEQLQRIYGTCWRTQQELNDHLTRMEKIKEIDHRNLGKKLKLFHMQQESPGCVFWHERGWTLYKIIEDYMRSTIQDTYKEVHTPQMIDRKLWEMSGHWEHFKDNMFCFENDAGAFALKPMNCPAHTQIFKSGVRSYKDLPFRLFEFGCCHRNESSGSLHGIMRVKQFVQDDGHIFCREVDIVSETRIFCTMLQNVYKDFGFNNIRVKFSTRPNHRAGDDATWDKAESLLRQGAELAGLDMELNEGEGAFYGPKLEFVIKDAVGRDWQCGTLQLDFVMPQRLNVKYVNENNEHVHPIMIHRAILGSLQRFIGILIEHYEGRFPLWLSPVQVAVVTLSQSDEILSYGAELMNDLKSLGIRAILDDRSERLQYKIQQLNSEDKIPCLCIVGAKEAQEGKVSLRVLSTSKVMKKEEFFEFLQKKCDYSADVYKVD